MANSLTDAVEPISTKAQLRDALLSKEEESEKKELFLDCLKNMVQKPNGECERDFEVVLTDYIENYHIDDNDIRLFNELSSSEIVQEKILGIYLQYKHYRKTMNYSQLNALLSNYSNLFSDRISLGHLKTLYHIVTPGNYTEKELLSHLRDSYSTYEGYRKLGSELENVNIAGAAHAYADLFATYCERYEDNESVFGSLFENEFEVASKTIIDAIKSDSTYAKYYCTYGRILALNHEYMDAIKNIQKAIGLEASAPRTEERTLKIMEYKGYLITVQTKAKLYALKSKQYELQLQQQELVEKTNDAAKHNLEVVSFFAGIISLTMGAFSIASNYTPIQAAALLIVLCGTLLMAFNGFHILLHKDENISPKTTKLFIIGLICMIGGICLVFTFQLLNKAGII